MSIVTRTVSGREYLYFQAGTKDYLYLGPVEGEPSLKKSENILKALDYLDEKIKHYKGIKEKLVSYLPEEEKKAYYFKLFSRSPVGNTDNASSLIFLISRRDNGQYAIMLSDTTDKMSVFMESAKKAAKFVSSEILRLSN